MSAIDSEIWSRARRIVHRGLRSSLHGAVASVDGDGHPHVTPIGSLMLQREPGRAVYFDVLNARLARNVDADPRVTILVVDSSRRTWARGMLRGRFDPPPGVQLRAIVGSRRAAAPAELARFRDAVGPLARTRGGRALWADVRHARDVQIEAIRWVRLGSLTSGARGELMQVSDT